MSIEPMFLVLIPVVIGIVAAIRKAGMTSRYAPISAIVLGIIGVWLSNSFILSGVLMLQGIVVGLSAAGLFSGVKASFKSGV